MRFKLAKPITIHCLGGRANQEDSIFPAEGQAVEADRLFILCDGMGGHDSGEVASATVCEAMSTYIMEKTKADECFTDADLKAALNAAYEALDAKDNGAPKKMGTTLTFLKLHRGGCLVAHIGDSRIYHLRPSTREVRYRSRDHSLVNDLYEVGEITYEEMRTSRSKNVITRAMQPHQEARAEADLVHITDIRVGDYFYLCSDGMLEQMEDDELLDILADKHLDDNGKREALIKATENNKDNHSALLIRINEVVNEEGDDKLPDDEAKALAANKALHPDAEVSVVEGTEQNDASPSPAVPMTDESTALPKTGSSMVWKVVMLALVVAIGVFAYFRFFGKQKVEVTRIELSQPARPITPPERMNVTTGTKNKKEKRDNVQGGVSVPSSVNHPDKVTGHPSANPVSAPATSPAQGQPSAAPVAPNKTDVSPGKINPTHTIEQLQNATEGGNSHNDKENPNKHK